MSKKINDHNKSFLGGLVFLLLVLSLFLVLFLAILQKNDYFLSWGWISFGTVFLYGVFVFIVLLGLFFYWWKKLVKYRNFVLNAYSNIDVQLKRRNNLLDSLLDVFGQYEKHEKSQLSSHLKRIDFDWIMENYPDLKANELFIDLRDELIDCEEQIAAAKEIYNENVLRYNKIVSVFPSSLVATINNYGEMDYWEEKN